MVCTSGIGASAKPVGSPPITWILWPAAHRVKPAISALP
jgi:hypothetical protein